MVDDDAGPQELGGEVTKQDQLNLLRLQIRQAQEAAAKLPELIEQIRAECPHAAVVQWLGSSQNNRYRFCICCGIREKDGPSGSVYRQFTGELRNAVPTLVSHEDGECMSADPWKDHKLPVNTNSP